ncbi:MAG: hypothetical protein JSV20_09725 [Candidatus Bathyarchaeota archaeon]|nr:MAG: hypothetical protein JSV20_09725 [Candidatus Bathyarchaeota archaeon]
MASLLVLTPIKPVSADTPVIIQINVSTDQDNTLLTIEIKHNNPTSSHYVNRIDVEIDNDVQSITGLDPQTQTQFTYTYDLGALEYETIRVRAHCNVHGWSSWATHGEQPQQGCFIATATYGSELSPEVQFLRNFRDSTVLTTYAGRNFMDVFNSFYYSWSPSVALPISGNEGLRRAMKMVLYPLIGILHTSSVAYSICSFNPECGVVAAGFVTSSLIGIVYFLPLTLIICIVKKIKISAKTLRMTSYIWLASIAGMILSEIARLDQFMKLFSSTFVIATITLTVLSSLKIALHLMDARKPIQMNIR